MNICFNLSVYWRVTDLRCWGFMFKKSDIGIQVKLEVVSKCTCVVVLICEKTTQIKRVSKKVHRFRFWSNQVRSQKRQQWHQSYNCECQHTNWWQNSWAAKMWLLWRKTCFQNAQSEKTDLNFFRVSFLSSEIDDPLDESFKVHGLEATDDDDESRTKATKEMFSNP